MDFQRLQQLLANMGGGRGGPAMDTPAPDTAEKIQISSLSLLKMLKHGKFCDIVQCDTAFLICDFFNYFRSCWRANGSNGFDVGTVCR